MGYLGRRVTFTTKSENLLIMYQVEDSKPCLSFPAKIADVFEVEILYREIPN